MEYFDGPHRINGVATVKFLHRNLDWPEPRTIPPPGNAPPRAKGQGSSGN